MIEEKKKLKAADLLAISRFKSKQIEEISFLSWETKFVSFQ